MLFLTRSGISTDPHLRQAKVRRAKIFPFNLIKR